MFPFMPEVVGLAIDRDVGGKPLNSIKSMHINSLTSIRVKGGENECFKIDSSVRQSCIMSIWLF